MVAACSAHRASDASVTPIASELGSLLLGYRSISEPRWRLRAVVALVPVCRQFGITLDKLGDELRRGVGAATCPLFWRARLARLLDEHFAHGEVGGLMRLVDALFTREWRACGITAIGAMLALGELTVAEQLTTATSWRRYAFDVARPLLQTGCVDGAFVGNVRAPSSERAYRPSLLLLRACVDAIVEQRQRARVSDLEALASSLPQRERAFAEAQLARLTSCFETPIAALARVRTIRERSVRAGALLLLTRSADDLGAMRLFASGIGTKLLRQAATLEITRALYRRGLHRHALRTLQYIDDPRLAAERILLGAEVRLTTRHIDEPGTFVSPQVLCAAYCSPAWTQVDPNIEVGAVDDVLRTVGLLRFGMRHHDDVTVFHAAGILRRHVFCQPSRRYFLDVAQRARIEIEPMLLSLQDGHNSAALDAVRAEGIAMRAERLVAQPLSAAMTLGLAGATIASSDARSLERAQYDEALSLSATAPARRRVLIAVAQTCLRSALAKPAEWSVEVVAARLRTLAHLGGSLAVDAIRKALATLPMHPRLTPLAFDALCNVDALAAARFVLERANEVHAASVDFPHLLRSLEQHAALPRGMWRDFAAAQRALAKHGIDPQPWIAELFVLMRDRVDALLRVLHGVSTYTVIPTSPRELLAEVDDVPHGLIARDHSTIAHELAADTSLLEALLLARPANVDPKMKAWSIEEWRGLLRQAVDYASVHAPQVARFVRKVGRRHWYNALRNANLAQLGVASTTTFKVRDAEYRLRLLDKRLDILTYLRFADGPARSCFRSDSDYRLARDTIEAWKDPLTICCHVEHAEHGRPCGFLFGSFAAVEDQPALVMNSLHVRPNDGELRTQVVHAFERAICEPLAISRIGIANDHGGKGELPASYVMRRMTIMRFRALAQNGWALVQTYDDISERLNEPVVVEGLLWRTSEHRPTV
jgi:hypothetical protein